MGRLPVLLFPNTPARATRCRSGEFFCRGTHAQRPRFDPEPFCLGYRKRTGGSIWAGMFQRPAHLRWSACAGL